MSSECTGRVRAGRHVGSRDVPIKFFAPDSSHLILSSYLVIPSPDPILVFSYIIQLHSAHFKYIKVIKINPVYVLDH